MKHLGLLFVALLAGCGGGEPGVHDPDLDPVVMTTFYPTTWMAERISGGLVEVRCPLPAEEDPIFWQPDRDTLAAYQSAALIVINGAGFEKWVDGASLPPSRVIDTAKGFEDQWLEYEGTTTHSHGAEGEHTHSGLDGHVWLDPLLAQEQAAAILGGMVAAFPEHEEGFRANHRGLHDALGELHVALSELATRLDDANVLASHPAYNYIARRYSFEVTSFDLDPAEPLRTEDREALKAALRPDRTNLLLWEGEPAEEDGGLDGLVGVHLSPCEQPPEEGDYLGVMQDNVEFLRGALGPW